MRDTHDLLDRQDERNATPGVAFSSAARARTFSAASACIAAFCVSLRT
jgi:hypothetical protein